MAAEHDVLTVAMDSYPASYFEEAEGRLFSVGSHLSMNRTREYRAWPGLLDEPAGLSDKTIGIIRTEEPQDEEAVDEALKPAIEELGYEVAAEAVLPCPDGSQNCAQHDAAIEKMKAAGVDFVFLTAQLLAGAATVEAAKNLNFDPEWATVGQQHHQDRRPVLRTDQGRLRRRLGARHHVPRLQRRREGVQRDGGRRRRRGVPRGLGRVRLHRQHLPANPRSSPRRSTRSTAPSPTRR